MAVETPATLRLNRSPETVLERLHLDAPLLKQQYGAFRLWLVNPESLTTKRKLPVFLVELHAPLTLIQFIGLEQAIGRAIGKKARLVLRQQYLEQHGVEAVQNAQLILE